MLLIQWETVTCVKVQYWAEWMSISYAWLNQAEQYSEISLIWTPKSEQFHIQDTYCDPKCCICLLANPWNQDTSIKWTPEMVPRVSGLERFHCSNLYNIFSGLVYGFFNYNFTVHLNTGNTDQCLVYDTELTHLDSLQESMVYHHRLAWRIWCWRYPVWSEENEGIIYSHLVMVVLSIDWQCLTWVSWSNLL